MAGGQTVADMFATPATPAAANDAAPPPGFTLEDASSPPPPPGFQLEGAPPARNFLSPLVDTVKGAVQSIKGDYQNAADAVNRNANGPDFAGDTKAFVNSFIHPLSPGGVLRGLDIPGTVVSPIQGAINTVSEPFDKATGLDLNKALMAMGPEAGAAGDASELAKLAKPAGPIASTVAPFTAAVSKGAAEQQAAKVLATRATNPTTVAEMLQQPGELVPGSQPTTFQQTGDMGLGSLEREVATKNPAEFNQARSDQNSARVNALGDIQQGADPNDVAKAIKNQFADLDAQTQADVDAAKQTAQTKVEAAGGTMSPEDAGEAIRQATSDAEDASKAKIGELYKVIDPDGTATANVAHTQTAAQNILEGVNKAARPMEGEEAAIFDFASNMPHLSPFEDLTTLRSRVSDAMREERGPGGSPQALRRLTQLRGAIEDNLTNTIAHQVTTDDAAVSRGTLPADQALGAKIQNWQDEFYTNRAQARAVDPDGHGGIAANGPAPLPGIRGAEGESGVGPGGAEGNPGLPGNGPTIDAGATDQIKAASDAYKEHVATYQQGPVGESLRSSGNKGQFRLPDGKVAAKYFHPGPTGFSDMQALLKATPAETTLPIVEDYAATTLRRSAMNEDGTLDPAKYQRWRKAFADSLRALPEQTVNKFSDAASAGQAVADSLAVRTATLKDAQSGAIGKVLKLESPEGVTNEVGQILSGSKPVEGMLQLAKATAKDPLARAGLRQAVADYVTKKLITNTEAGTSGQALISADKFQTFIKTARPALRLIFKPEEVETFEAIAEDIQRAKRSENAVKLPGGSNTTQDILAVNKGKQSPVVKVIIDALAGGAGFAAHGSPGALVGVLGAHLLQTMRAAGISRVDELVTQAMLHPEIARQLLNKTPRPSSVWQAGLAKAIRSAQVGSLSGLANIQNDRKQEAVN